MLITGVRDLLFWGLVAAARVLHHQQVSAVRVNGNAIAVNDVLFLMISLSLLLGTILLFPFYNLQES